MPVKIRIGDIEVSRETRRNGDIVTRELRQSPRGSESHVRVVVVQKGNDRSYVPFISKLDQVGKTEKVISVSQTPQPDLSGCAALCARQAASAPKRAKTPRAKTPGAKTSTILYDFIISSPFSQQ